MDTEGNICDGKEGSISVVGVVQARLGSTRLPEKVLHPLEGHPVLWHVMTRLAQCVAVDKWVVATTENQADDKIEEFCGEHGFLCFRGSENDVLERYFSAAIDFGADYVVRITSDNPLTDPRLVDDVVLKALTGRYDYFGLWDSNPRVFNFPDGLDVEFISMRALAESDEQAEASFEREHVTFWVRNHPELFRIGHYERDKNSVFSFSRHLREYRFTLDTAADYEFIKAVYAALYRDNDEVFGHLEVLQLLSERPELLKINGDIENNFGMIKSMEEYQKKEMKIDGFERRYITNFSRSFEYRDEVHEYIPGGAHTYSKGDDQFPHLAPAAFVRGHGCYVWDLDGNKYIDCALGLGSIGLGHCYEQVQEAVHEQIDRGSNFQRPAHIELTTAKSFLRLIPQHDRIKFCKNGSTANTAAVKLARAFTQRDLVAFPNSHPFYSYDDWFIGHKPNNSGIPSDVRNLSLLFDPMDPATLDDLFQRHPSRIAAVVLEPEEMVVSDPDRIKELCQICRKHGALFVLDEMQSGFRAGLPGAIGAYGYECDLATFGKAVGNGYSFCCLTGRAEIMDLGGIKQTERERVFLVSTTHGGEAHALAAASAVIREYTTKNVIFHQHRMVAVAEAGFTRAIERTGLSEYIELKVLPWRIIVLCKNSARDVDMGFRTLLLQEMIGRGVLFQGLYLGCFSHRDADLDHIIKAFEASCMVYKRALEEGLDKYLVGEPVKAVFRRWNNDTCGAQIR